MQQIALFPRFIFFDNVLNLDNDSITTIRKVYSFAGMAVAMTSYEAGTPETVTLVYFLADHLGSVAAVTDDSGALLSEQRYLPFGEVRTDVGTVTQTDFGYTGQRDLDAQGNAYSLGLMDYNARFYDRTLKRKSPHKTGAGGQKRRRGVCYLSSCFLYSKPLGYNAGDNA